MIKYKVNTVERTMSMSRILLLEDDLSLMNGLSFALKKQGFDLDTARTVRDAGRLWTGSRYDLLLLDVSLPDGTGFELCEKVRQTSNVPVIFLTASDDEVNIVMGLDIGGDDYITKPFKLGILLSRINALLRRARNFESADTGFSSNGITLRPLQGQADRDGESLNLTTMEYRLLALFMQHPNQVLSKEQILDKLWDSEGNYTDENTLAVYVRRLRMKIEADPGNPKLLLTIRRMGYKWNICP